VSARLQQERDSESVDDVKVRHVCDVLKGDMFCDVSARLQKERDSEPVNDVEMRCFVQNVQVRQVCSVQVRHAFS
jgi:hypothetical protein